MRCRFPRQKQIGPFGRAREDEPHASVARELLRQPRESPLELVDGQRRVGRRHVEEGIRAGGDDADRRRARTPRACPRPRSRPPCSASSSGRRIRAAERRRPTPYARNPWPAQRARGSRQRAGFGRPGDDAFVEERALQRHAARELAVLPAGHLTVVGQDEDVVLMLGKPVDDAADLADGAIDAVERAEGAAAARARTRGPRRRSRGS